MDWTFSSDISNFLGGLDDELSRKHFFILRLLKHMPKKKGNIGSKRRKQSRQHCLPDIEEESPEELLEAWEASSEEDECDELHEELQDAVRAKLVLERQVRALEQRVEQLQHIGARVPLLRQGVLDLIRTGGTTTGDALAALQRCFDFSERDMTRQCAATPAAATGTSMASLSVQLNHAAAPRALSPSPSPRDHVLDFMESELPIYLDAKHGRLQRKAVSDSGIEQQRIMDAFAREVEVKEASKQLQGDDQGTTRVRDWIGAYLGLRSCMAARKPSQVGWVWLEEGSRRRST